MARGDMKIDTLAVSTEEEILNRKEFQAIPNTVDFTNVDDVADNGEKVVKAGTPINNDGVPVTASPWTGVAGILLHDTYESRPQQAVLKQAYIHTTRAQANSALTYDGALAAALNLAGCRIVFEEPVILATAPTSGGA